jgi:protein-S-isoprenylcysteine O-methyltransferase Ste14
MAGLAERLIAQGNWLFCRRSYLPLLILPILLIALKDSLWLEKALGDMMENLWEILCLAVSLLGLGVRCMTVGFAPRGTSGRTTQGQRASVLNTTGMYSIVRHPLYLGNFIITLGLILFVAVWWFGLLGVLAFWLYYERIMIAEEEFLQRRFGASYAEWAEKTPAILPRFKNWKPPSISFSMRNVLKREYSGFFLIIASFSLLDIAEDLLTKGRWESNLEWIALFFVGLMIYATLRTLKRKTKILDVEGR